MTRPSQPDQPRTFLQKMLSRDQHRGIPFVTTTVFMIVGLLLTLAAVWYAQAGPAVSANILAVAFGFMTLTNAVQFAQAIWLRRRDRISGNK